HVVEPVALDARAVLRAERVDRAHVGEDRAVAVLEPADVVDDVLQHEIARRERLAVAPGPADRDAGVEEVRDVVAVDLVAFALPDPDADRAREHPAAVVDRAALDVVRARPRAHVRIDRRLADLHSSSAEVSKVAVVEAAVITAASERDAV